MRFHPIRQLFLSATAGLLLMAPARAQMSQNFALDDKGNSTVTVTQVFTKLPPSGYSPIRVSVKNATKSAIAISLSANSATPVARGTHNLASGGFSFEAKADESGTGSVTEREFMIPLMTDFSVSSGYYNDSANLSLDVSADGRHFECRFNNSRESGTPFVAFSNALTGKSLDALNELIRNGGSGSSSTITSGYRRESGFATDFTLRDLPSDWRGYMGLDGLAMTPEEWLTLQPGVTTAIRQWIVMGGVLDFYTNGPHPAAVLQQLKPDGIRSENLQLGSGSVRVLDWDGSELSTVQASIPRYKGNSDLKIRNQTAIDDFRSSGLADSLELRNFAAWQVGIILLIFGILVGPVNLFYFAGPGRRHRLFFTTPVISLGASAILIAVIFLQDGSGGAGKRAAIIEIRPDENNAYIQQYQISRTGVLFGNGFQLAEASCLTPLLMNSSRWTRLKPAGSADAEGQHFSQPETLSYGGDWFQSRSEQAQMLETIRPGRGRLELQPGPGAPVIVSSLGFPLIKIFYTDDAQRIWTADTPLTTGGTLTLRPAVENEFSNFLTARITLFPAGKFTGTGKNWFVGLSNDSASGFVETLPSIKWTEESALVHGPLTTAP